ncbi:SERTA domain-containing protein 2 [Silurus asotus]|uniref:SERTA domain-containing protein 2 n=1 Tax=Silurus asotus TaxID=30991 RepID=A0AAD5A186_SILAS|nr:SERTA domain-containing protein 2 [Silurus asotus]
MRTVSAGTYHHFHFTRTAITCDSDWDIAQSLPVINTVKFVYYGNEAKTSKILPNTCLMSGMDLKRALDPEDEDGPDLQPKMAAIWAESSTVYSWQRQTVLQLSLQKLCHVPTLGRRVLITNTLRLIQEEIGHQGALRPTPVPEDRQRLSQHHVVEVSLTPAWVLEQDDKPDFCPKNTFSPTLPQTGDASAETPTQSLESYLQPTLSQTPSPVTPAALLPDLSLDDFLFSDLDNFLCEFNPCTLSLSPTPASQSKVVSMVTDDFVRTLTNQPFKTDMNELEHIMEVLVGS